MTALKLGSLFDGIGVFPLAAIRCGMEPVWASEIEARPISITRRHFPDMLHLGDITKISGAEVLPVDVITFGSPCQDLSQIGTRNGFASMLRAFTGAEVSVPPRGWAHAGMVRGGRADTAWRLLDAQYWGEPALVQRRKRVFVVADFAGQRAGEVLFKPRTVLPFSALGGPGGLPATARGGVPAAQTGRQVPIVRPFSLRRMRTMAQVGDQKGFCASFGRGGEPFPTLLASVTAPFSFWYEGAEQDGFLRVLTPLECERLMGLPENWTKYGCKNEEISDHARYRALGNSIALPCAEYVMAGIVEVMN